MEPHFFNVENISSLAEAGSESKSFNGTTFLQRGKFWFFARLFFFYFASMEPHFFNVENWAKKPGNDWARTASMEPHFFNVENQISGLNDMGERLASMEPHFFNVENNSFKNRFA